MTALAITIRGGHGYAEHRRILATVAGTTKPLRADGAVTFDVPKGAAAITVDVVVRRPPWATAHGFAEDDHETARIELDLHGKQYGVRWPMHPRLLESRGATRGGSAIEVVLDYRFIDVTKYYLRGEVYNRRHPNGQRTLSGLDPANNADPDPGGGNLRRPGSVSVRFLEWTTRRRCRLWCVALPYAFDAAAPHDWLLFLVPKGPKTPVRSLLDFDFEIPRRYLLDPPAWSPRFVYAPVKHSEMTTVTNFRSNYAHEIYLKEPHTPAALLTQVARASRPTVLVAPVPEDQSEGRYDDLKNEQLLETDLLSLRAALLDRVQQPHTGGWTGAERFACAGFSASALHPFDIARVVATFAARSPGSPDLALLGLIDPPQFTEMTARALAAWQRADSARTALLIGGDHHEAISGAVRRAGVNLEVDPAREDFYAEDPNPFAQAVFTPPREVPWSAAPLVEASEGEIVAARGGHHSIAIARGSTSDLVGWIRSTGPDRRLYTTDLEEVPMSASMRTQLAGLSTMELSGYIGWLHEQKAHPRQPARDVAAFVRKSSDLRHQWAVASGDVLTRILARWK